MVTECRHTRPKQNSLLHNLPHPQLFLAESPTWQACWLVSCGALCFLLDGYTWLHLSRLTVGQKILTASNTRGRTEQNAAGSKFITVWPKRGMGILSKRSAPIGLWDRCHTTNNYGVVCESKQILSLFLFFPTSRSHDWCRSEVKDPSLDTCLPDRQLRLFTSVTFPSLAFSVGCSKSLPRISTASHLSRTWVAAFGIYCSSASQ